MSEVPPFPCHPVRAVAKHPGPPGRDGLPPAWGVPSSLLREGTRQVKGVPSPVRDFVKRNGDLYFRLYVPINWPCARTCPSIARRSSFFVAPGLRLSSVSSA